MQEAHVRQQQSSRKSLKCLTVLFIITFAINTISNKQLSIILNKLQEL